LIEAFHAEPREVVVNRLYQHLPKLQSWEGQAQGLPLTFYTEAKSSFAAAAASISVRRDLSSWKA
jgi:hypothetical protein